MSTVTEREYFFRYFDLRGRGEPVRWLLKMTKATYHEERITYDDSWPNRKRDFDWGVLPVLDVDGIQLHQTMAICKYLARNYNLMPEDNWDQARLEEVVETVHELSIGLGTALDARLEKKTEILPQLLKAAQERVATVLGKIDPMITTQGWLRSSKMTWADVVIASYLDLLNYYFNNITSSYVNLDRMLTKVTEKPEIKDWIQSRPPMRSYEEKF